MRTIDNLKLLGMKGVVKLNINTSKDRNKALGITLENLRENRGFGSIFQFWVNQTTSVLENKLEGHTDLSDSKIHDIAIEIIRNISQESYK